MQRNLEEVLASENKMLTRLGKPREVPDQEMSLMLNKHLNHVKIWLQEQANIDLRYMNFNQMIKSPMLFIKELPEFLETDLNMDAMAAVVDPNLYRNRS